MTNRLRTYTLHATIIPERYPPDTRQHYLRSADYAKEFLEDVEVTYLSFYPLSLERNEAFLCRFSILNEEGDAVSLWYFPIPTVCAVGKGRAIDLPYTVEVKKQQGEEWKETFYVDGRRLLQVTVNGITLYVRNAIWLMDAAEQTLLAD